MYGVFILKNGKWDLHQDGFSSFADASVEKNYLANSIGVVAGIFKRVSA